MYLRGTNEQFSHTLFCWITVLHNAYNQYFWFKCFDIWQTGALIVCLFKYAVAFAIFSLVTKILTFFLSYEHIWNCRNLNCYISQIDLDIVFKFSRFITLIDYCKAIKDLKLKL